MQRYTSVEPEWLDSAGVMTLGGDSRTTFHRRRTTDPHFPKPAYRGRRPFWPAAEVRAYYTDLAERGIDAGPSDALREARRRAGLASVEARRRKRETDHKRAIDVSSGKREIDVSPSASTTKVL